MTRGSLGRTLLLAVVVLLAPACDPPLREEVDHDRPAGSESEGLPTAFTWGCEHAIPSDVSALDPRWREEATVVGNLGFNLTAGDFSGFRRHKRADIEAKLPVTIDGHSGATVWVPPQERDRVALILANVPRRGPGNSYRIEDGHHGVRFEPCVDKKWTAWTAGLALADRKEIVLKVDVDGAGDPTRVTLGPWASFTIDR
jgi:hypothetical protein